MDKNLDKGELAAGMVLFGFAGLFLTVVLAIYIGLASIFLFVIEILFIIIGRIILKIEDSKYETAYISNINKFQKEYDEYTNKLGIVKNESQVTLIESDEYDFKMEIPQYLWVANECINLFPMAQYYIKSQISSVERPNITELKIKSIPIKSVQYFGKIGKIYRHQIEIPEKSITKNLLFGKAIYDAGGEVMGVEKLVTTKVIVEDKRKTKLVYKKAKNKQITLMFRYDAYEVFKKLIPFKELQE